MEKNNAFIQQKNGRIRDHRIRRARKETAMISLTYTQDNIEFVHAIHSTEHSSEQDELYAKLLTKIESQQNTEVDLNFWAEIYHVIDLMPRSNSTETIANTTTESTISKSETTTTDVNNNSSIVEVDEPESVTEKPSTSTKNK